MSLSNLNQDLAENKKIIDFFCQLSNYFESLNRADDSLVCPEHRIEHTGKNIYSAVIDSELFDLTGEDKYYQRAKKRVERTLTKLIKDPQSGNWIFYPGRLSRWNASNSIIDAGACSDVLSTFYLKYSEKLTEEEKTNIKDTIFKNCQTYLFQEVIEKPITNQRLWGATGLAKAYQIFKKEEWRQNLIKSVEKSFSEMWPDGTFPYHPKGQEYKIFKGVNESTPYYHSRCIGFIYYILENIEADLNQYKEKLVGATDLLLAMYRPNGLKEINLECKRWYWNSDYEIASNSFDVYALIKSYQLSGNEIYLSYVKRAFSQILKHQLFDGGITSHLARPRNNFQCRIFWNGHLAWLARIISDSLPSDLKEADEGLKYYKNSGILKFKNNSYSCILRAKKQPMSLIWGPAIAGGSLLYFGTKKDNWQDILKIRPWLEKSSGNFIFYIQNNYFGSFKNFILKNKREIKEELHHVLVRLRKPSVVNFFHSLYLLVRNVFIAGGRKYTSQWSTGSESFVSNNQALFILKPSKRDGKELEDIEIKRRYSFEAERLYVSEEIFVKNSKVKKIKYNKVNGFKDFSLDTDLKYKDEADSILFNINHSNSSLKISYYL